MKFRFISYGFKYYEALAEQPPVHDFLFNLRDLDNPFWVEELRSLHGLEDKIKDFFLANPAIQTRLTKVQDLVKDFIEDAIKNSSRSDTEAITFAFRCTGGKHRSVYFAQSVFEFMKNTFKDIDYLLETDKKIDFEVEHIDLPRYQGIKGI